MNKTEYQIIDARFRGVLGRIASQLSEEGRQNVEHYIEAAEVEMACESLVLSVMEEQIPLSGDVKKELLEFCSTLRLDEEPVFRADFWQIAHPFLSGQG
jgi:hypothetical protein